MHVENSPARITSARNLGDGRKKNHPINRRRRAGRRRAGGCQHKSRRGEYRRISRTSANIKKPRGRIGGKRGVSPYNRSSVHETFGVSAAVRCTSGHRVLHSGRCRGI